MAHTQIRKSHKCVICLWCPCSPKRVWSKHKRLSLPRITHDNQELLCFQDWLHAKHRPVGCKNIRKVFSRGRTSAARSEGEGSPLKSEECVYCFPKKVPLYKGCRHPMLGSHERNRPFGDFFLGSPSIFWTVVCVCVCRRRRVVGGPRLPVDLLLAKPANDRLKRLFFRIRS